MIFGSMRKIVILTVVGVVVGLIYAFSALRPPGQVLDDILVFGEGSRAVIQVRFSIPVRYENHVPEKEGEVLQIKVRTVSISGGDTREYRGRESLLRGFAEQVPLIDVAYEGDVPGGPFLTLRFSKPVKYQVREDVSNKSILISVPKSEARRPRNA